MKTILHEVREGVMINVQGDAPPSDGDWDEFLAAVAAASNLRAFI